MAELRPFFRLFAVGSDLFHGTDSQLSVCRLCRRFREQLLVRDAQQCTGMSGTQSTSVFTSSGSFSSRREFATALRDFPTRFATSSCVRWNMSISCA